MVSIKFEESRSRNKFTKEDFPLWFCNEKRGTLWGCYLMDGEIYATELSGADEPTILTIKEFNEDFFEEDDKVVDLDITVKLQ